MRISELVESLLLLQKLHGDIEVTYVDNGVFAEEWPKIDPCFCQVYSKRDQKIIECVVL